MSAENNIFVKIVSKNVSEKEVHNVYGNILVYFKKGNKAAKLKYGDFIWIKKPLQIVTNSGNPGSFNNQQYQAFQQIYHQVYLTENDYKVLGIGINTTSNSNGVFSVNYTTLTQAKDNLKNLILTRKGERLMQPEFGCDVWKVLFEQLDGMLIETSIESSILDAVSIWLPYLNIDTIVFDYDENDIDNNRIALDIKFSLVSNKNLSESVQITVNN
jgi:phage baseplate assembly protein W